jgi:ABC-type sugar transport system substrate-binding protein
MRSSRLAASAAVTALAFGAAGCGASDNATGSGGDPGTVQVDVGTGTPVRLTTGKLRIGLFMNGITNEGEKNYVESAKETAEANGAELKVFDAQYDSAQQRQQLQQAATNKDFDAVISFTVDGVQACDVLTKTLPQANVLVVVTAGQICGRTDRAGDENWAPGTLNFVGGDSTVAYQQAWVETAARLNPGPQKVAVVVGPELAPFTATEKKVVEDFEKAHPEFDVRDFIYTDYTTPSGYSATLSYLQAHPDTTLFMSVYSPDLTRGVIQALHAVGKAGKIPIADMGGSQYSVEQIKAGTIQFTLPYALRTEAKKAVESILAAQSGKTPERFVSEFPEGMGTPTEPLVVTPENVDEFTPEY